MSRLGEKISRLKDAESLDDKSSTSESSASSGANRETASANHRDVSLTNHHESSPIKEAIFTKFAKLAPVALTSAAASATSAVAASAANENAESLSGSPKTSSGEQSTPQSQPSGASWIHQVKGRFTKTVEEKVSEYRQEKELRRLSQNVRMLENDRDIGADGDSESGSCSSLPHSLSENHFVSEPKPETVTEIVTPSSSPPRAPAVNRSEEPSPKEKRRFTFNFRDRTPKIVKSDEIPAATAATTVNGSDENTPPSSIMDSTPQTVSATPSRSSLRVKMMGLISKSPGVATAPIPTGQRYEPAVSVNMTELRRSPLGEDPFSGIDLGISRLPQDEHSNSPSSNALKNRPDHLNVTPFGSFPDIEVETALEADEALTFEPGEEGPEASDLVMEPDASSSPQPPQQSFQHYLQYWWFLCIPLCVILIIQILPLPYWVLGFITGLIIAGPSGAYVSLRVLASLDDSPRTTFIENAPRKKAKRSAIIIQEEIQSKYTWMNLWPFKKGPYDPLTYDVRLTSTVRVMLHGPWLELRFPRTNFPLRRSHDDAEPTQVEFHNRIEVIDLSTCSIELLPRNLPSKRVWSKKYPIMIRTNTRKPRSSPETSRQMAASSPDQYLLTEISKTEEENSKSSKSDSDNDNDNFEEIMFDAKEDLSDDEEKVRKSSIVNVLRRRKVTGCDNKVAKEKTPTPSDKIDDPSSSFVIVSEEESNKTFYLFTRTSREKEEWFNRFLVAAKFMEDWEHQNPKDPSRVDPNYETQKVKQQKFNIFMEDYFQARSEEDGAKKHEEILKTPSLKQCAREQMAFFNIYAARLWHDLHDSKVFIDYLRDKLTRKLLKVKIAQYFNDVRVTTLDLGPQLPKVLSASLPWQDELGLWVNLEVEYTGLCQATVETQGIHLPAKDEPDQEAKELWSSRLAATIDSDEEDSAEEDDEGGGATSNGDADIFESEDPGFEGLTPHAAGGFRARVLDSLLRSEFVAKVAESEWVKKNITGKAITLQLQLHAIKGTLTVNFPPAPSDRIWYGFRTPPELEIALRPCFGGHPLGKYEGTFSKIMKHLEKRLKVEFMKVLVYPNLDDEFLPFMDHVIYSLNTNTAVLKQSPLSPQTPP